MKNTIKKYFTRIVIGILIVVILFQSMCQGKKILPPQTPLVKTEIKYIKVTDTIIKNVKIANIDDSYVPKEKELQPSADYDTLNDSFIKLVNLYVRKTTYKDTIHLNIDTLKIGNVYVTDTVQFNKLKKRTYNFDYKIPVIEKTVTIKEEPKRQLYIGGNISSSKKAIESISPGLIYKSKKDQLYELNAGINLEGDFIVGGGVYWKLKF